MTTAELYAFLSGQRLGVLSYVSAAGSPQAALMGIAVTPECEIVFDTVKMSRKYGNLLARPACSIVIGCQGETTVQYEGVARELSGAELAVYKQIYFAAYPDGPEREKWPGITYFVVRPTWARYSGYDQRPPRIEEMRWP